MAEGTGQRLRAVHHGGMSISPSSDQRNEKREGYIEWEEYYMAVAFLSAQRSKDPRTQVGACIVNGDKKIVGMGYNGMPNRCSDDDMPWNHDGENLLKTKGLFVCHAELNAILNTTSAELKGSTMYVVLSPCNECAKLIIQSGIKRVVYYSDKKKEKKEYIAAKLMFVKADVKYEPYGDLKNENGEPFKTYLDKIDFSEIDARTANSTEDNE